MATLNADKTVYTMEEWIAEAERRFGADRLDWKFVCPSCGHIASAREYLDAGAPAGAIAFSCIGRWIKGTDAKKTFMHGGGPCVYAGGGLFGLNPVTIEGGEESNQMFDFAPATTTKGG